MFHEVHAGHLVKHCGRKRITSVTGVSSDEVLRKSSIRSGEMKKIRNLKMSLIKGFRQVRTKNEVR